MKYVIHAYEQMYSGLHGIEDYTFEEGDLKFIEETARELSFELMESYEFIVNDLHERAEFYSGTDDDEEAEEFQESLDAAYEENVGYTIYLLEDDLSDEEVLELLANDPETLVRDHCSIAIAM